MKPTDLMIGDWVMIKDYPMKAMPKQMSPEYYTRSLVEIEPIPLTKEILEKNGFEGNVYLWIDAGDEKTLVYYPFEHRLTLEYGDKLEILFKCHCFSVHELQHALKLCGIEKEIVLQ